MRVSDAPYGHGRASSDLTLLLFLVVFAMKPQLLITSLWLLWDGEFLGALTFLGSGAREYLSTPILLLLLGTIALTVAAWRRRAFAQDFDLLCIVLVPLVVIELLHTLLHALFHTFLPTEILFAPSLIIGYAGSLTLLFFAFQQTRSRS